MLHSLGPCLLFVGWGEENEGVVTHVALDSWSQSSVWSRVWGWRLLPSAFVSWTVLSWKPADLVLIPSRGQGLGWGHGQEWEESIKQARKQPWINHYCFITTLHPPPSALLLFTGWHPAMPNHGHLEGNFHSNLMRHILCKRICRKGSPREIAAFDSQPFIFKAWRKRKTPDLIKWYDLRNHPASLWLRIKVNNLRRYT